MKFNFLRKCAIFFLASVPVLSGCAKTGEPQPPEILIPRPSVDLSARQYSGRIRLSVSMPAENTDGSRASGPLRVEVFRAVVGRDPAVRFLPEEQFFARARRVGSIDPGELAPHVEDGSLVFWDDSALEAMDDRYENGLLYAVRFINRKNQTAGLGNEAYIAPVPIPPPPAGLTCDLSRDFIRLNWKPPEANAAGSAYPRIAGYNVYRSDAPGSFPSDPLNDAPLGEPEFEDRNFEFGRTYYYAVTVVVSETEPYAESILSGTLPVTAQDTFAPAPPRQLTSVVEKGIVILLWAPSEDSDVAGYRIYRRVSGTGDFQPLRPGLVTLLSLRDDEAKAGKKYDYRVTAVDAAGNEGSAAEVTVEVQ